MNKAINLSHKFGLITFMWSVKFHIHALLYPQPFKFILKSIGWSINKLNDLQMFVHIILLKTRGEQEVKQR